MKALLWMEAAWISPTYLAFILYAPWLLLIADVSRLLILLPCSMMPLETTLL